MSDTPTPKITLVVDDEHPWFDTVFEHSRSLRRVGIVELVKAPDPPTMSVDLAGTKHDYVLEYIAEVNWSGARVWMRTVWQPTGKPAPTTTEENQTA